MIDIREQKHCSLRTSMEGFTIPLYMSFLFSILIISDAVDTITKNQSLADGETIVSPGGSFEMGFFSPGNSKNRYVGIWYKEIPIRTVVWVANREIPISDTSGVLKLVNPGILVLLNGTENVIWSSNTSRSTQDPVAQLLDSGNLLVRNAYDDMKTENFLWQSFDYPGDTILPGMKAGKNLLTGQEWYYSSWKSNDDPARGEYTSGFDTRGYPEIVMRKGTVEVYRSGPWNGLRFSGSFHDKPIFRFNYDFKFNYAFNTEVVYYTYEVLNSLVMRTVLTHDGVIQSWSWDDRTREWVLFDYIPTHSCDKYGSCGNYGVCNIDNSPLCGCLDKYVPKYPKEWGLLDFSSGCVRRTPLDCHDGVGDGFLKYSRVKLPDTRNSWFDIRMTLEECRRMCLGNCSCVAYANLDIRDGGRGCLLWFGDLIDIIVFGEGDGQDIYLRMASSELDSTSKIADKERDSRNKRWKWIILALAVSLTLLTTAFFYCVRRRKLHKEGEDLLLFDLGTSIGAHNDTLTEASDSQKRRRKLIYHSSDLLVYLLLRITSLMLISSERVVLDLFTRESY